MKVINKAFVTALAISLCFNETAQARIINSISPPIGAGLGDVFCPQVQTDVNTPFPNNDNSIGLSQNQINSDNSLSCSPKTFQAIAPIDTQLFVEPSGGTTEYLFNETVINQTSSTWDGYNFQIGFGVNDEFAPPELILVSPGFAIPDFNSNASTDNKPTSSKFAQLIQDGSFNLAWSGGFVAPGESVDFRFSVDVPDDLAGNNFYNSFTIRQLPIAASVSVPEPTSIISLLGLVGLFGSRFALKYKLK